MSAMITKNLKISIMLSTYPQTLEVLLNASPHFKKLENKLLRKTLASRVTVEQAASIAGVNLNSLLDKLNKSINPSNTDSLKREEKIMNEKKSNEEILTETNFNPDKIIPLDVRPILDSGKDPFLDIMVNIKKLNEDEVLLIINSFEPSPLYSVLGNKGFDHITKKDGDVFKIYFFKKSGKLTKETGTKPNDENSSEQSDFENVIEIDVRGLEPPEPMIKVLEALSNVDEKTLLLVHHHREPMMLYPKLEERGYTAVTHKVEENYFKVLISKKKN